MRDSRRQRAHAWSRFQGLEETDNVTAVPGPEGLCVWTRANGQELIDSLLGPCAWWSVGLLQQCDKCLIQSGGSHGSERPSQPPLLIRWQVHEVLAASPQMSSLESSLCVGRLNEILHGQNVAYDFISLNRKISHQNSVSDEFVLFTVCLLQEKPERMCTYTEICESAQIIVTQCKHLFFTFQNRFLQFTLVKFTLFCVYYYEFRAGVTKFYY